ncbi:ROK family transcriptional regulator [Pseudonocardia xinjiangensis]|uniref:ROK family transcriptional regulator n=1 Tax=Pseudonocardia xinjiangensis TaxID=75289 RepID=A0ABX1R9M5_9PSEU|nr:ROK family transcriptional regulator [Pseudonocardia xinjiangensis]NMH76349.1 ROK family transcriptional regulator [Pseudonocardia xinjiangensis]
MVHAPGRPPGDGRPGDPALTARIVALISSGAATSRTELARGLGLAASTVSLRVQELIDLGVVRETGAGPSRGGRRPRLLELCSDGGFVLVADVGGTHARAGVVDFTGALSDVEEIPVPVAAGAGPEATLDLLGGVFDDLVRRRAGGESATEGIGASGIGIALPGPVDLERRCADSPSRMPGWDGFPVGRWLEERFGVVTVVENDANLMALGEHVSSAHPVRHSVTVKAGSAIGSGIVVDGVVYRGADGAAGDFSHARVPAGGDIPCSCGNTGCLETIASGAALVRVLQAAGRDVTDTAQVIRLARSGDPEATTLVRTAGRHLGEVLCTVVNFFNPGAVFLGGGLSTVEPFVAAVRSQLYEGCHPLVTQRLLIARASAGADAGLVGAGRSVLDRVLAQPLPVAVR